MTKQQQYSLPLTHILCLLFLTFTPTYWFKIQSLSSRLHCGCSSASPYILFCSHPEERVFSLRRLRKFSRHHSDSERSHQFSSVQFSSVAQSCPTLCDPMNRSMPGLPVHHHLMEFTQSHIHRVSDAIQLSHPRSSPSPPAPNPSQHQSLFQ